MTSTFEFVPTDREKKVLRAFAKWISQPRFGPRYATKWGQLCHNDLEAATCEAAFWDVLIGFGLDVHPNDIGDGVSAPDYLCLKRQNKFYVEVTCIRLETATQKTNLQPVWSSASDARHYATLNEAITNACRNKTRQCANLDGPCLVAVGTFHFEASALLITQRHVGELLTDESQIGWAFDAVAGHAVGEPYLVTDFRRAAFTRVRQSGLAHFRDPISGLLVAGFGVDPTRLFGVLNPGAVRPIDSALLPSVPFCRQKVDNIKHTVSAEWLEPITK